MDWYSHPLSEGSCVGIRFGRKKRNQFMHNFKITKIRTLINFSPFSEIIFYSKHIFIFFSNGKSTNGCLFYIMNSRVFVSIKWPVFWTEMCVSSTLFWVAVMWATQRGWFFIRISPLRELFSNIASSGERRMEVTFELIFYLHYWESVGGSLPH